MQLTAPVMSNALFGSRYWMATLLLSIAMHLLIMHGLPWLNQINLQPAGAQGITASFKVLPNPTPVVSTPLPEILPKPEIPIEPLPEPIKPKPIKKQKAPPKVEPVLQSTEVAQKEDFAIAEQTPDVETETPVEETEVVPETTTEATPQPTTNTAAMQPTEASAMEPSASVNSANTSPISSPNPTAQANQESGLLDAYGRDLQRLCDRNKQYPSIAIRRNLEGSGSVLVTFNEDGTVNNISIEQSTGQSSLDAQAIKMVEKSLRALPLPNKLSGQVLTLSVPVSFRLEG